MQTHVLAPHSAFAPGEVTAVTVRWAELPDKRLMLRYMVEGCAALVLPAYRGRGRGEELWKTTCFEAFIQPRGGAGYVELNLSPSERWAAWDFSGHRVNIGDRPMPREPECTMHRGSIFAIFDAAVPAAGVPNEECALGLTAVIEEEGGAISFWAIAHPASGRPDFHDAACFTGTLPAPGRP